MHRKLHGRHAHLRNQRDDANRHRQHKQQPAQPQADDLPAVSFHQLAVTQCVGMARSAVEHQSKQREQQHQYHDNDIADDALIESTAAQRIQMPPNRPDIQLCSFILHQPHQRRERQQPQQHQSRHPQRTRNLLPVAVQRQHRHRRHRRTGEEELHGFRRALAHRQGDKNQHQRAEQRQRPQRRVQQEQQRAQTRRPDRHRHPLRAQQVAFARFEPRNAFQHRFFDRHVGHSTPFGFAGNSSPIFIVYYTGFCPVLQLLFLSDSVCR